MADYLLEIGTEELPADFVSGAIAQWQTLIPQSLTENLLTPEKVSVYGTPRRLAVLITGIPEKQPDKEEEIKGPPASAAFKDGQPTEVANGFARKQGVDVANFEVKETDKGAFVFVQKKTIGQEATAILKEISFKWLTALEGRRFMRWGDGDLRFPRPIRWLVALFNDQVLPLELVNGATRLTSDRTSRGHRILHPQPVTINHASNYLEALRSAAVEADPEIRQQQITESVNAAATKVGGYAEINPDLLAEVVNLVELPTAVVGNFDPEFLGLPPEVIKTVMVTHQRYFPVQATPDANSELLPCFITIGNGNPEKSAIIATGNEKVIRARLADAQFFYTSDCDDRLECYLPQLENVTFQEQLGTIHDKVDRLMEIAQQICEQLDLAPEDRNTVESAAMLCKADLVTQMVYEFPELQGIMGRQYALVSGESEAVANAIFEHYLPRGAGDLMPESIAGQVVGLADRLDTLINIFGLGMLPTGSSDPFALRRAANAVVNITWYGDLGINLGQLLEQGAADFMTAHPEFKNPLTALQEFFMQRIQTLLEDDLGIDYDLVKAVLGNNDPEYTQRALTDVIDVRDRAQFLQEIRQNQLLSTIYETVNRSTRLAVKGDLNKQELNPQAVIKPELFEKASEKAFYDALVSLVPTTESAQEQRNYQLLVDALAQIAPTVSKFFDGEDSVLVMAEDPAIKQNRLNLLGLLRNHARVLADFGEIIK